MKYLICLLIALGSTVAQAKIKLPALISDYMVLQQQSDVRIWGEAAPQATVSATASWLDKQVRVQADKDGRWELRLPTATASFEEQTLKLAEGKETVTIGHILIGEVWFCSGQSNMVMPLKGFDYCPIKDANLVIADASNHPAIRMATVKPVVKLTPQEYAEGSWLPSTVDNAPGFSAVAYHYALALQRTLQVPVGVITCAWGGSRVEGWLPKEILQTYPDEDLTQIGRDKPTPVYLQSMLMYNAMLYPCHKYTVKGFTWYQGESNVRSSATYAERLATMVAHWRTLWQQGNLPFYYVEIKPFACEYKEGGNIGALLREAQQKALSLIPNSGMIGTNDLVEDYERTQIHTCRKKEVGDRLAHLALNKTYGYKGLYSEYPAYQNMVVKDSCIEISLSNTEKGLSPWTGITGFEIAGADKVFYPAEARLNQKAHTVVVTSDKVPAPVAVRYCFRNFLKGNLTNIRNLPVRPFRTDQW